MVHFLPGVCPGILRRHGLQFWNSAFWKYPSSHFPHFHNGLGQEASQEVCFLLSFSRFANMEKVKGGIITFLRGKFLVVKQWLDIATILLISKPLFQFRFFLIIQKITSEPSEYIGMVRPYFTLKTIYVTIDHYCRFHFLIFIAWCVKKHRIWQLLFEPTHFSKCMLVAFFFFLPSQVGSESFQCTDALHICHLH